MPRTAAAAATAPQPQTFDPPPDGTLARLEGSMARLLTASEPHEPSAPPAIAFRLALRRFAGDALAAGGTAALEYLSRRLIAAEPDRAEVREAILQTAWDGLPGWKP